MKHRKLQEQKGATMLMALFLLLAATMISGVILSAAISSAKNVPAERQEQQAYLTVSSAADFLRNEIVLSSLSYQKTRKAPIKQPNDWKTISESMTGAPADGILSPLLLKAGKSVYQSQTEYRKENIVLSVPGLEPVGVDFVMKRDYSIVIQLSLSGETPCRMYLSIPGSRTEPTVTTTKSEQEITETTSFSVSWNTGLAEIRKGETP